MMDQKPQKTGNKSTGLSTRELDEKANQETGREDKDDSDNDKSRNSESLKLCLSPLQPMEPQLIENPQKSFLLSF